MSKAAIIGTGLVGRAWAIVLARAGHAVALWDEDSAAPARALAFVDEVLPELAGNDLLLGRTPEAVRANLSVASSLKAALTDVIHVQESTPERLAVKQAIFRRLDGASPPGAVIASSSSAILPSHFTEALAGRARCLVVHPLNPPYLVPAAEVVPAPWTSPATVTRTRDLLVAAGMTPIMMQREIDGFIMNRLQGALLEEAFRLVADGYASVEDIDIGIRDGLALRWSFIGPFETIDLNAPGGIEDYVGRYQHIYANLFTQMQRRVDWAGDVLKVVARERRERLPAAGLAERQTWRDKRLTALAAHKRRAAKDIGE